MPLQKQNLSVPFANGVETKDDPFQIPSDKFLNVVNAIYTNNKKLTKRNGFPTLTILPDDSSTTITTYNSNLAAIGNNFWAYSADSNQWINKGIYKPVRLATQSLTRSSLQQSRLDVAVSSNGLICSVYLDGDGNYKYQISDQIGGEIIVKAVSLGSAVRHIRSYVLGNYFVITYVTTTGGLSLSYIAVPLNNLTSPRAAVPISTTLTSIDAPYDAFTDGTNLYFAWVRTAALIGSTFVDLHLNQHQTVNHIVAGSVDNISLTVDLTQGSQVIYISYHESGSNFIKMMVLDNALVQTLANTIVATDANFATHLISITSSAQDNLNTIFISLALSYAFDAAVENDKLYTTTCTNVGVVGTYTLIANGFCAASKSFLSNSKIFILTAHQSSYQPSYYLLDVDGKAVSRFAYQNGGGKPDTIVLPNVWVYDQVANVGYQLKDFLVSLNKSQGAPTVGGLYTQLGINLSTLNLSTTKLLTAEIGNNLHLAGGFLWMYDGNDVVEHGFQLYPEDIEAIPSITGGSMVAQLYNYQVTYEWTDSQGNIHRSAPSIPIAVTVASGTTGLVLLQIPTLRLTYKTSVRIVIYRWSVAQQSFYETTSVTNPLLNDPTVDYVNFVDASSDSDIIGNTLIYTTGGVVENIPAPATNVVALYKSRLVLIDAENTNVIWFSKQVVQNVPVETSDLFTLYVAPTIAAQGSTGPLTALSSLDDKLIAFKNNAIYYITGTGPDITGAQNDFSDPIFVTSTIGCSNQQSISFMPQGLMFQSTNGQWLLGRNLSTDYIGSPVQLYNDLEVTSALNPPGTNEIRLSLENGLTLMYDFYYGRWGTFDNTPIISSTVYNQLHTYLMDTGEIRQELPGTYVDGTSPVLMSFSTAWFNLASLQGYERFYFLYILGEFKTPNKLNIQISYDYNPSPSQSVLISASNYALPYGGGSYYGDQSPYGGPGNIEQWRIFAQRQRCQAFQIQVNEIFDPQYGTLPGEGLSFSGLNLVYGLKKGFNPQPTASSAG